MLRRVSCKFSNCCLGAAEDYTIEEILAEIHESIIFLIIELKGALSYEKALEMPIPTLYTIIKSVNKRLKKMGN